MTDQQTKRCAICTLLPPLLGLLLLLGFWWTVGKSKAELIENDLSLKSNQLLTDSEIAGVIVTMDGRDATLTGMVTNEARSQKIESIVASQSGIRIVNNRLEIAQPEHEIQPAEEPVPIVEIEPNFEPQLSPEVEVALAPKPEPEIIEAPQEEIVEEFLQTLDLSGITFLFGSDEITEKGKVILNDVAAVLKEHHELNVLVEGHTDNAGDDQLNQGLSEKRALSVMNYLISQGIESERLSSTGFGETIPIASNETVEGRALNRRIEFAVTRRP